MSDALSFPSPNRDGEELTHLLFDHGPMTSAEVLRRLGWTRSRFDRAMAVARDETCPALGLAIPSPTPHDGWLYQVTDEWEPVEAGASYSLSLVEKRLGKVHRTVHAIKPRLEVGSIEWRRANFLDKHLEHILGTLEEIGHG